MYFLLNKIKYPLIIIFCCLFFISFSSPINAITFRPSIGLPVKVDNQPLTGCNPADKDTITYDENGEEVGNKYEECGVPVDGNTLGNFIKGLYQYAVGIVGIVSTIVLMWGGVLWIVAGGNAERVGNAKAWMTASLTGLVLTFTSYMILASINEKLVEFKTLEIKSAGKELTGPIDMTGLEDCHWRNRYNNITTVKKSELYCPNPDEDHGELWCVCDVKSTAADPTPTITATHAECRRIDVISSGPTSRVYKCEQVIGEGEDLCQADGECNANNSY